MILEGINIIPRDTQSLYSFSFLELFFPKCSDYVCVWFLFCLWKCFLFGYLDCAFFKFVAPSMLMDVCFVYFQVSSYLQVDTRQFGLSIDTMVQSTNRRSRGVCRVPADIYEQAFRALYGTRCVQTTDHLEGHWCATLPRKMEDDYTPWISNMQPTGGPWLCSCLITACSLNFCE